MAATALRSGAAWRKIVGAVRKALYPYNDTFPEEDPFSFIKDDRNEAEDKFSLHTSSQQGQENWDTSCVLNSIADYKTLS
jgi:hypothetical protein